MSAPARTIERFGRALLAALIASTVLIAVPTAAHASRRIVFATEAEGASTSAATEGAGSDWVSRVADNGKGPVWQEPGAVGNANSIRIMDPTVQYPNGYVRFYNEYNQPVGLNGNPGPNADTHIPLNPDGT